MESQSFALANPADQTAGQEVLLANGAVQRLEGLSRDELLALQWVQERHSPPKSWPRRRGRPCGAK